eukprot:244339-Chlamydomonas_euryale.AAC.1
MVGARLMGPWSQHRFQRRADSNGYQVPMRRIFKCGTGSNIAQIPMEQCGRRPSCLLASIRKAALLFPRSQSVALAHERACWLAGSCAPRGFTVPQPAMPSRPFFAPALPPLPSSTLPYVCLPPLPFALLHACRTTPFPPPPS